MKVVGFILFVTTSVLSQAQSFDFLQLSPTARMAALGGNSISNTDGDVSQAFWNPSVLDSVDRGDFSLIVNPFFSGISRYSAIAKVNFDRSKNWVAGVVYTNYGEFTRRDDTGQNEGSFRAADYYLQVGKSHSVGLFSLGANLKFAQTFIDGNSAAGIFGDLSGTFRHPDREFSLSMVFKDFGFALSDFGTAESTQIPFDILIGTTFKPEYMPVRFTFTIYDLVNSDFYEVADETEATNIDKAFRHLNAGLEFIIGDYIEILAGYNQKRRAELRLSEFAYGAGLSIGLLLKLKNLNIRYTRSSFHAAGGTSFIALQTNYHAMKNIF